MQTEKGNNTQSDSGSSDSDDGGNTTGSTKGQRSVRGKRMRTRSGRSCKKEMEVSNTEVEGESMEGRSRQKPGRRKGAKSKSTEKMKSPSSSDDSENETLGDIISRTKRKSSESSDVPLSVVKGKLKEDRKIEGLKEEVEEKLPSQAALSKIKSKVSSPAQNKFSYMIIIMQQAHCF